MRLKTIKRIYDELNYENFRNALTRPTILMSRMRDNHGQYTYGGLSPNVISFNPIDDDNVRGTVYHEMVHQYVEEVLGVDDNAEHGDYFWLVYYLFANGTFEWEKEYD